jgi:hypothetical protein
MAGLINFDCEGTLTIGGVLMNRLAFMTQADEDGNGGLSQFLTLADQRGEDRILPGTAGVIAYKRRLTVTKLTIRLVVIGDVLYSGSIPSTPKIGLFTNLKYIYDNVVAPTGTGDGTRSMSVVLPGPFTGSGTAHITRMDTVTQKISEGSGPAVWEGQLGISIPAGRFTFT